MATQEETAAAYLAYYRTKADSLFWAWEVVDDAARTLEHGLPMCLALIEAAEDEAELMYIAAGPLEDLLLRVGEPAAEALEVPARRSAKVRKALQGVWLRPEADAYKRWHAMVQKYGS